MSEQKYIRVEDINIPINQKTYTPSDILAGMWVPVSERLPRPYKKVLVWTEDVGVRVDYYIQNVGAEFGCVGVTHWMPLPEPPKEDKP